MFVYIHMKVWKCLSLSCVCLFVTPWIVADQAPLSMDIHTRIHICIMYVHVYIYHICSAQVWNITEQWSLSNGCLSMCIIISSSRRRSRSSCSWRAGLDGPQGMNAREHRGFCERKKFKVGVSLKENSKSWTDLLNENGLRHSGQGEI